MTDPPPRPPRRRGSMDMDIGGSGDVTTTSSYHHTGSKIMTGTLGGSTSSNGGGGGGATTSSSFTVTSCTHPTSADTRHATDSSYFSTSTNKMRNGSYGGGGGSGSGWYHQNHHFIGRRKELQLLCECYQQHLQQQQQKQVLVENNNCYHQQTVLVTGESGTGKTSLVRQFLTTCVNNDSCNNSCSSKKMSNSQDNNGGSAIVFQLQGKFEESSHNSGNTTTPFAALEQAFGECILQIQALPEEERRDVCQDILLALEEEGRAILSSSGIIPALNTLFVLEDTPQDQLSLYNNSSHQHTTKSNSHSSSNSNSNSSSFSKSKKLQYFLAKFISALTTGTTTTSTSSSNDKKENYRQERQLILSLDDWHCADPSSLELLAYLLTENIPRFFVVGTYRPLPRDGGGDDDHPLMSWLRRRKEYIKIISLENHSRSEIEELLHHELQLGRRWRRRRGSTSLHHNMDYEDNDNGNDHESNDQSLPQALTDAILNKTKGNIFFAKQVIEELQRQQGLLQLVDHYYGDSRSNRCAEEEDPTKQLLSAISMYTTKNATVIDAVTDKIQRLSPQVQRTLMIASYLMRSTFDIQTLHGVLVHLNNRYDHHNHHRDRFNDEKNEEEEVPATTTGLNSLEDLIRSLDAAVVQGLLQNDVGSHLYRFTHDKIKEAAASNLQVIKGGPAGSEHKQLLYQIGSFLSGSSYHQNVAGEEWKIFVGAHHLAMVQELVDPVDLANLLLQCGQRSITMAATEQAATYFHQAMKALERIDSPWQRQYILTLEIYQSLAECRLAIGEYELGYRIGRLVLEKAQSLTDSLPTYTALDHAMMMQERHSEALALDMQVLKQLGHSPGPVAGVRDIVKVRGLVKNHTDDEVLSLPQISDEKAHASIRFLSNASVHAYCAGKSVLTISCIMKQIKLAFKYGLCSEVAKSFALYGAILFGHLGDQSTGRRMGRLAREILKKPNFRDLECETLFICAVFIDMWSSYPTAISTFEQAHRVGVVGGNHTYGHGALVEGVWTSFVAGQNLREVEKRYRECSAKLRQFKLGFLIRVMDSLGSLILPLRLQEPEEANNSNTSDSERCTTMSEYSGSDDNKLGLTWECFARMILAYYLGHYEEARYHSKQFNTVCAEESYTLQSLGAFYSGLINIQLYRITGRWKFKTRAQRLTTKLGKTVTAGGSNNRHKYHLMEAECMSVFQQRRSSQAVIKQKYDRSIAEASEIGCIQDEALANELAGEYCFKCNEKLFAKDYLARACQLYDEWGAKVKVNQLLAKHSAYLGGSLLEGSVLSAKFGSDGQCYKDIPSLSITASDDLASDEVSGLTPIDENSTYNAERKNRWDMSGSKGLKQSPPRLPPQRTRSN